ncbi:MAG: FKBP-type peptidyl-prolyl cis-trans isomerase [Candidatus Pacebacteria bacterium]|jgi:FKBP-type peptidyl-prolyl cis-trans isomerase|nr:FKBP-type peptidyl-prolyl cis-trans isomerase [Candidatus Paceibacterota bacterium]
MFSKVEIAGIALSVTAMAAALYLVTKDDSSLALSSTSQTAEVGRVFVSDEGDQAGNLRDAIVSAADSTGNLSKLIVDDVIFGTGDEVKVGDTVTVHYIGTLQNGQEFDNSNKRGTPFTFTVGEGKVIKGWEEGIVGMKKGGKRILVVPSDLGYGDKGYGPIPGGANLVFAVDLLEIAVKTE